MAIPQGFAEHRGRGGGRGVGLRQKRGVLLSLAAPKPPLYRGGWEGLRPHLGFPPQGVRPALDGAWGAAKGGRSASQVKWRPSPLGFPLSHAHGPWGGWCPWPIKARAPPYSPCCCIGRGGTFSGPPDPSGILRNLLEASRYNTEKTRTFPGTRTTTFHIYIFTSGPFRNSS